MKEHGTDITETYEDVTNENDTTSSYDDSSVIGGITKVVRNSAKKPYLKKAHVNPTTESANENPEGRKNPDEDAEALIPP